MLPAGRDGEILFRQTPYRFPVFISPSQKGIFWRSNMRRAYYFLSAIPVCALLAGYERPVGKALPDRVAATLFGSACTHEWTAVNAGGTVYCDCSGDTVRYKDTGGSNGTKQAACSTNIACSYDSNGACNEG
jgi:hypothetical protein